MDILEDNLTENEQKIVLSGFDKVDKAIANGSNTIKNFTFVVRNPDFCGSLKARLSWGNFHIVEIFVDEKQRGQGIGTLLLNHAIDVAKKHNSSFISIKTCNLEAKALYEKLGFILHDSMTGYNFGITFYTLIYKL